MYEACATHGCRYDVEAVQRAVALGSNVKVLYDIGERELHLLACHYETWRRAIKRAARRL